MNRLICVLGLLGCAVLLATEENLIANGDFSQGLNGWSDVASDGDRDVGVVELDGKKALKLSRKKAGAAALATRYNLRLKPQTLYRLSVTGKGEGGAVGLKPGNDQDKDIKALYKSWATASCPLPKSEALHTETLLIDTGFKLNNAFVNLHAGGKEPCTHYVTGVSLTEVGSSKPNPDEFVLLHLGDSITITSYLPFSERIDALLDKKFGEKLADSKVRQINLAADGEFCKELFSTSRYTKLVKENYPRIDAVVIRYGANDQPRYSPEEFKKTLTQLCDSLMQDYPGIAIVLGTGPFVPGSAAANQKYAPYWQVARDLAAERNYPLADIFKRFEQENAEKTGRAKGDMHPSAFGVQLAAEVEFAALEGLLKKRAKK